MKMPSIQRVIQAEVLGRGGLKPFFGIRQQIKRGRRRDIQPRQVNLKIKPIFKKFDETANVFIAEDPVGPAVGRRCQKPRLRTDIGEGRARGIAPGIHELVKAKADRAFVALRHIIALSIAIPASQPVARLAHQCDNGKFLARGGLEIGADKAMKAPDIGMF